MKRLVVLSNGFTLVEIMIVIAVIGILAAIAIPQMAVYRTRAYNSSAESDLRNILGAEATLLDDGLAYGSSGEGALPGTGGSQGAGTLIVGSISPATESSSGGLISGKHPVTGQVVGAGIGLGNGVFFRADTMAQDASFIVYARHRMGQRAFAFDVDNTSMMVCENKNWVGREGLLVTTAATVQSGVMDLTGACSTEPAANWTAF